MFAYCLSNPINRTDVGGSISYDYKNEDANNNNNPLDDTGRIGDGKGPYVAGDSGTTSNTGGSGVSANTSGPGKAPPQGTPGSTYTQYSSDGNNSMVSQTTYNQAGLPGQRIDYGHSHGSIGAPHIHVFSYTVRDGKFFRNGEDIYAYRME